MAIRSVLKIGKKILSKNEKPGMKPKHPHSPRQGRRATRGYGKAYMKGGKVK